MADTFFIPTNDVRKPWQRALEWLVRQNLQPGDTIWQTDITFALGMCDPDSLPNRAAMRKWEVARIPEVESLVEAFETETGLILMATHRGSYMVLHPEEVSTEVLAQMLRRVKRAMDVCSGKITRAATSGVSQPEMERRNRALEYVANVKAFMSRERRKSLSDVA